MRLTQESQERIKRQIFEFADRIIQRRVDSEPFDEEDFTARRPFHAALVPMEIWKAAKFERSFTTSQGQAGFEGIAREIATACGLHAENSYEVAGTIYQRQLSAIQQILDELERGARKPNWEGELGEVVGAKGGAKVEARVIADLCVKRGDVDEFYEIKSSKPNSDQTKVSKEKMLKLHVLVPGCRTFFALPDNPYLTKEQYGWSHPKRWFDMNNDSCVIMGRDFWDHLGGSGTYEELLGLFREVGAITKKRIREEYLGL